jgi:hypothetical protein
LESGEILFKQGHPSCQTDFTTLGYFAAADAGERNTRRISVGCRPMRPFNLDLRTESSMTTKSEKKAGKAKPAAKPSAKSSAELSGDELQAVTGGLSSTGGVSSGGSVCVSQT